MTRAPTLARTLLALSLFLVLGGASAGSCFGRDDRDDDECQTDADCPDGTCALGATCAAIGCPPPPPNVCVPDDPPNYCDDGSMALCEIIPPICPDGQITAIRNSCYECVDADSCTPGGGWCDTDSDCGPGLQCNDITECAVCAPDEFCPGESCLLTRICEPAESCTDPDCNDPCWGAWLDENGSCRAPNDGGYPAECCGGSVCPADGDPGVSYISTDPLECARIAFMCADGDAFSNDCGCGCLEPGYCTELAESDCAADPMCEPVYGPSNCDPLGLTCTADEALLECVTRW